MIVFVVCFYCLVYGHHRALHILPSSYPTRRASDLTAPAATSTLGMWTAARAVTDPDVTRAYTVPSEPPAVNVPSLATDEPSAGASTVHDTVSQIGRAHV